MIDGFHLEDCQIRLGCADFQRRHVKGIVADIERCKLCEGIEVDASELIVVEIQDIEIRQCRKVGRSGIAAFEIEIVDKRGFAVDFYGCVGIDTARQYCSVDGAVGNCDRIDRHFLFSIAEINLDGGFL